MADLYTDYKRLYNAAAAIAQQTDSAETLFFAGLVGGEHKRVVDIGCAEGKLVVECARRGHQVTAVDIAEGFLQQTAQLARTHNLPINTILADLEEGITPFGSQLFDVIFLNDVIEHFRNPVAALYHLRALLAEGGKLFIHTPNCASPGRLKHYLLHPHARLNYYDPTVLGDFHFQTYDQMTLEKTLNFVGLEVVRMIPTRFTTLGVHALSKVFGFLPSWLAKRFPHLADTLLFECAKGRPLDLDAQLSFWTHSLDSLDSLDKKRGTD
jgi:2-polyprenyl-3-methyl-5-hydroxy-6-metoxy-1,4-benzoquinol methylase